MYFALTHEHLCNIGLRVCRPLQPAAARLSLHQSVLTYQQEGITHVGVQVKEPNVLEQGQTIPATIVKTTAAKSKMAASSKIKVAALHGHAQSALRFKGKIAALTSHVKSLAQFEFVDGPFRVPHREDVDKDDLVDGLTWLDTKEHGRAVFSNYSLGSVERSFEMISSLQCDGLIGFSLGAAVLATCLCHPEYGPELKTRLRFVGFFSGFIPADPQMRNWIRASTLSGLPSFHCFGKTDTLITPDRSESLATCFQEPVLCTHDGGHVVPASVRKEFKQFLAELPELR